MLDQPLTLEEIMPMPKGHIGLAVLGYPIHHSISPNLHNAALAKMAEERKEFSNWTYRMVELMPENLEKGIARLQECGYIGLNLTIPHKVEVLPYLASIQKNAQIMGAVNTLVWENEGWHGYNTDGYGIEMGLKEKLGANIHGSEVLILGAGGASRAAASQCLSGGCQKLWLGNRSVDRLEEVASILKTNYPSANIHSFPLNMFPSELAEKKNLIIINATSLGLNNEDAQPCDLTLFAASSRIFDMIYNPVKTNFLQIAEKLGMENANGLSMLVHQAAKALELWTKQKVNINSMYEAVPQNLR
jgi:shikimate dehydrogenase